MKIWYRWAGVLAWMSVIFLFSSGDASTSSTQSGFIVDALKGTSIELPGDVLTFLTRKAAHIFLYFVLGLLVCGTIHEYGRRSTKMVILSVVICFLYAITDELHQWFVPGRSAEVRDVVIDTLSSGAGVMVYHYISRVKSKKTI